ncbi:tRNA-(ms[2]io[6]A)-hydroxylase [Endozoicomonas euniceicola]|uniref:tRNA isopentenyl-2-thiomethyl-A-37 hydroxylase MiaE n=1 Tax=Endozoicomonas euniceicola TaxID=1234143 RepID=A0ABY6GVK5_9GAMM|nr:tRNA isopentenyl-2-thiomethyl-A-37 hydroxylase MiaE [Endozoicomonas euniceicola]UYM16078.1 tRNA isopentenyl-2-thiomethyl-A-37 hydroxylase MiaE [Endozoicomonas euniceicola]
MPRTIDITPALDFLPCRTPDAWVEEAIKPENQEILLIDHLNNEFKAAQSAMSMMRRYGLSGVMGGDHVDQRVQAGDRCSGKKNDNEKKAASTALNQMFRYIHHEDLLHKMSRLAREELLHFEQVMKLMKKRNIRYRQVSASRYHGLMREQVRKREPGQLVDILVCGAFVEARSCERFHKLAFHVDDELAKFYRSLLLSEGRHFMDYLTLAESIAQTDISDRIAVFAAIDRKAVESGDQQFRFHSGRPD